LNGSRQLINLEDEALTGPAYTGLAQVRASFKAAKSDFFDI